MQRGFLFAALPGTKLDGKRFIGDAIARGAAAILVDNAGGVDAAVPIITDANPRQRFAKMAAAFYTPQPKTIAAVTGTNGKTSITVFLRQILGRARPQSREPRHDRPFRARYASGSGSLTTPDPVTLHRDLALLAKAGIDHVALEASSHGLDQFRLDGLALTAAAFTNLTRDHLDYHADMEAYFSAKARLFTELLPANGIAVFNIDASQTARLSRLCHGRGQRIISYRPAIRPRISGCRTRSPKASASASPSPASARSTRFGVPLLGTFQAWNALPAPSRSRSPAARRRARRSTRSASSPAFPAACSASPRHRLSSITRIRPMRCRLR